MSLILATDPDCDRMGAAAPVSTDTSGRWVTFTGNQLGALLVDYLLDRRQKAGCLSRDHYVVKTLVTSELIRRIADSFGVRTLGNLHVGFKWIAQQMDAAGPELFVLGTEESHGYLVGHYARDKDAVSACMLLAELAAETKAAGRSIYEKLESLWWQHGYHVEHTINVFMEGSEGMARMRKLMETLRAHPPATLGGQRVAAVRDYQALTRTDAAGHRQPLDAPPADMVMIDFTADGNYVAVRPSGTEPKVKFYLFGFTPAELLHDLDAQRAEMDRRLQAVGDAVRALAAAV
jgi:phosphomannomutase